jgi:hypothetical protein
MSIDAAHYGRRIELLFIVRNEDKPDAWQTQLPFLVAPGESLSRLVEATAELFKPGGHS